MGLFNYIDTFFFISLGITFILILLLVFHFKQRIASLEQKNETMFEIINNMVQELVQIKYIITSQQPVENVTPPSSIHLIHNPSLPMNMPMNNIIHFDNNKIVVSDDEYDVDDRKDIGESILESINIDMNILQQQEQQEQQQQQQQQEQQ